MNEPLMPVSVRAARYLADLSKNARLGDEGSVTMLSEYLQAIDQTPAFKKAIFDELKRIDRECLADVQSRQARDKTPGLPLKNRIKSNPFDKMFVTGA